MRQEASGFPPPPADMGASPGYPRESLAIKFFCRGAAMSVRAFSRAIKRTVGCKSCRMAVGHDPAENGRKPLGVDAIVGVC